MTSTAMKGTTEIIYISDDEPNDCVIDSASSCWKLDIQAISSDGKGFHNLQEVVSRSNLTNLESSNTTKVSLDVKKNHDEISSSSKHQSPIKTFSVYISSTDGSRQWFDVVPYKAKVKIGSNNDGSQPSSSPKTASLQDIRDDHQYSSTSLPENSDKENGKAPSSKKSRRKLVSAEECDICSPPYHTCKQFANVTGNFTPSRRNIKLNKFLAFKPGTLRKRKDLQTERIDQARMRKIKTKRRPFWQCIYCEKIFQLAGYCEQHEINCREGNRGKRSNVLASQLKCPSHPQKYL
ncbi:uncharacterized protein LOC130691863 [Daphnia carinata]|uniref:uncharacterized protein LOC130691863 n=1 Tax=Daphnia carinata TaxID=120202 RepID=UPI00257DC3A6|nr:uncharacterized protein LOC130691863 [Daphnia carinata]